jgi:hypothetical protein
MRWAMACYVLFIIALAAAILYAGPVTQVAFGHDLFFALEGGWKILHGDRLYVDFPSLVGPIPHLFMAMAISLTGPVPAAFPVATVITLLPISVLTWHVLARRLHPLFCLGAATYLMLVWTAPYPLHFYFGATTYAMTYNRYGYVFLGLLMAMLLSPRRPDWFYVGLLLGLLFFNKIPHFISGIGLLAYHFVLQRPDRKALLPAVTGFLTIAVPITLFLGLDGLAGMISLFIQAGEARSPDVISTGITLLETELPNALSVLLAAVCFLIVFQEKNASSDKSRAVLTRDNWKLTAEAVIVVLISILTEMGGSPLGYLFDIPLLGLYSVILMDRAFTRATYTWNFYRSPAAWSSFAVIASCWFLIEPLWYHSYLSVYMTLQDRIASRCRFYTSQDVIEAPGYENMLIIGTSGTYPKDRTYTDKINDGLKLIRSHPDFRHKVIATLDFTDAFSCTRGNTSPPHMPLSLQFGVNVNDRVYPDPAVILSGTQGLMIPKYPDSDLRTVPLLLDKYKGYIDAHYTVRGESLFWTLYARNP